VCAYMRVCVRVCVCVTFTVYRNESRARALTCATGAAESDVLWYSLGVASPLSSSAIDTCSDNVYYQSVNTFTRLSPLYSFHSHLGWCNSVIPAASIKEEKSFSYPIYAALNMQYQVLKRNRSTLSLLLSYAVPAPEEVP